MKKQCQNCKHFKPTVQYWGICLLLVGMIGQNCHKYQSCNSFKKIEQQEDKANGNN